METTSSREIYANPWMTIREDTFVRPDGGQGIYGVVDKPHYALVIALQGDAQRSGAGPSKGDAQRSGAGPSKDDAMMLVEQFRYPIGLRRWEFPQGTAPDRAVVDPAELAARELREETGLTARSWHPLGLLDVAPGLSSQRGRAFLATDLDAGEPDREETEADMRAAWFTRAEFEDMVRAGEITDAQSIAAYALLLLSGR